MKSMCILIVVSLLFLSLGIGLTLWMHKDVDILIGYAMDMKEAAEKEDEEGIERAIDQFSELWNHREHSWEFFCNHNDLNDVTISFIQIRHSFAQREYEYIELESSLLILSLQNIHEKEIPRIENII